MQFSMKQFLSLALLFSTVGIHAGSNGNCCATECNPGNTIITPCDFSDCCDNALKCCNDDHVYYGRTHYSARPQGSNAARHLMGTLNRTHVFGQEEFYMLASLAVEYGETFNRDNRCARNLGTWFAPKCSNCITFGPDQNHPTAALNQTGLFSTAATGITNELKAGVDARGLDFGLSASHKSTLCIYPKIKNAVVDLDFWFGLDEWMCGLWARVNVPLAWTKWEVCTKETTTNAGGDFYGCGSRVDCPGNCPLTTNPLLQPLTAASAVAYKTQKDAWCGDKPFGQVPALRFGKLCNRKNDEFNVAGIRFDVGYDFWREDYGHVGAGLVAVAGLGTQPCAERLFQPVVGAQRSWQLGLTLNASYELWECDDSSVSLLMDTTLTHIFKHRQQRLFGLKGRGPWSHYLLLKKFRPDAAGTGFVLDGFERAANILAGYVKVKNDIMIDSAWALAYHHCNWGATVGLDFWYRSRDEISDSCGFGIEERRYGIKGITECNAKTASLSTINTSRGVGLNNIFYTAANGIPTWADDGYTDTAGTIPNTITLRPSDVDPCPGLHPDALSGKLFGSLEYGWEDCDWSPFVALGGEVEFGRGNAALDQWGVIFKGGFTY